MTDRAVQIVDKLWGRPDLLFEVMTELMRRKPYALSEWTLHDTAEKGRLLWRRWRDLPDGRNQSFVFIEGPFGKRTTYYGEVRDPDDQEVLFEVHALGKGEAGRQIDEELVKLGYRSPPDVPFLPDVSPWQRDDESVEQPRLYREVHDGRLVEVFWDGDGYTARIGRGGHVDHRYGNDLVKLLKRIDFELGERGFAVGESKLPGGILP